MPRAILVFFGLTALGMVGAWLADHPGLLSLQWGVQRIETSTAVAATVLLALLILVAGIYRFWRWLLSSPLALSQRRAEGRRRKGYQSLSSGLIAVAAGDAGQAKKLARRTAQLLDEPSLTLLLSAQAAQLEGDEAAARDHFQAMAERPETEFLGLRGLLVQARRAGRRVEALTLARRAFALRPHAPWVGRELFSLEAAAGDWRAAEKTLTHVIKRKLLTGEAAARCRAIVLFVQAMEAADAGEAKRALELARKAHAQLPAFSPATALAGRLHHAGGEARKARRLLLAAWRTAPHPELAAAWLDIHPSDEAGERLKVVQKLVAETADHGESRRALARAALAAGEYDQARAQLKVLMEQAPTAGVARLIADLEETERGDGAAARQWLRQAAALPADPTWICQDCGRQNGGRNGHWAPHCPDCGSFDTFVWCAPPVAVLPHAPGAIKEVAGDKDADVEILPPDAEPAPT